MADREFMGTWIQFLNHFLIIFNVHGKVDDDTTLSCSHWVKSKLSFSFLSSTKGPFGKTY